MKKHVFLILAHKNIALLKNLVNTLCTFNGDIIIHFDEKSNATYKEAFKDEIDAGAVHFIENNIKVYWAGVTMIRATFLLIDYAVQNFPGRSHYHLLSEHCFPVKSPGYFADFFEENKGINFIECCKLPEERQGGKAMVERIDHYYLHDHYNVSSKKINDVFLRWINSLARYAQGGLRFKRKYPASFPQLYGGSQWWSLTGEAIKYLDNYYKKNAVVVNRFAHTRMADEIFVQTLFMTSPFAQKRKNNSNARYIHFQVGTHPVTLSIKDHWNFLQGKDILFTRKINGDDWSLVEKLKKEVIFKKQNSIVAEGQ